MDVSQLRPGESFHPENSCTWSWSVSTDHKVMLRGQTSRIALLYQMRSAVWFELT